MENELWSTTLYPFLDPRTNRWVIAFDEDGQYYTSSSPEDDFYAPVPDYYASRAAAEVAIAVLQAWEAPVANEEEVLSFEALRATRVWAALVPFLPESVIGEYSETQFQEAEDMGMTGGLPGAYDHYLAMVESGTQIGKE